MMSGRTNDRSPERNNRSGGGVAVGLAFGTALILALGNPALIGVSISIGLVVGAGLFIGAALCDAVNRHNRGNN